MIVLYACAHECVAFANDDDDDGDKYIMQRRHDGG